MRIYNLLSNLILKSTPDLHYLLHFLHHFIKNNARTSNSPSMCVKLSYCLLSRPVGVFLNVQVLDLTLGGLVVRLHVLVEMIGAGEAFGASRTHKPFLSCVRPQVALQFVRPSEGFLTEGPAAGVWPLPGVPPQVCLQLRRLAIRLATGGHVAHMSAPFFADGGRVRLVLAVRALTFAGPAGGGGGGGETVFKQGGGNLCFLAWFGGQGSGWWLPGWILVSRWVGPVVPPLRGGARTRVISGTRDGAGGRGEGRCGRIARLI